MESYPYPSQDYISQVVSEKHYIEAILLLHMALESDLIDLIIEETYNRGKGAEIKDSSGNSYPVKENEWEKLDFLNAARTCLFMDIITDTLFVKLQSFNTARNKLAHRALKEQFVSLPLEKKCKEGLDLAEKLNDIRLQLQTSKGTGQKN